MATRRQWTVSSAHAGFCLKIARHSWPAQKKNGLRLRVRSRLPSFSEVPRSKRGAPIGRPFCVLEFGTRLEVDLQGELSEPTFVICAAVVADAALGSINCAGKCGDIEGAFLKE